MNFFCNQHFLQGFIYTVLDFCKCWRIPSMAHHISLFSILLMSTNVFTLTEITTNVKEYLFYTRWSKSTKGEISEILSLKLVFKIDLHLSLCLLIALSAKFGAGGCFLFLSNPISPFWQCSLMVKYIDLAWAEHGNK